MVFKIEDLHKKRLVVCVSLLIAGLISYADYLTGIEIQLSILMLFPIYFVTWYTGFSNGLILSFICAGSFLIEPIIKRKLFFNPWEISGNTIILLMFFIIFTFVLSKLRQELVKNILMSRTDNLTGLLNSRAFFEVAEQERIRSIRDGHPFTLCFLDLDNFKKINDTLGHLTGDELLRIVADVLKAGVRKTDIVARLGGDEFCIVFLEAGKEAAEELAFKLHEALYNELRKRGWEVTPSMGVAIFYKIPGTINDILHHADQLMYSSKKAGKNKFRTDVIGPVPKK
jgi:diguanylate cyclase (GGDEF)-like protein